MDPSPAYPEIANPNSSIVCIVDDDPGIRKGFQARIESASMRAQLFSSAEQFLEELNGQFFGCVIVDMYMHCMTGMEMLQRLRALNCEIPVILISGHASVPVAVEGMKLGAFDFLQKPVDPNMLIETVRKALRRGERARQVQAEKDAAKARFRLLSERELTVLDRVIDGHSSKRIAAQLDISVKTVSRHRANIMIKTGASNTADIVRLAQVADVCSNGNGG